MSALKRLSRRRRDRHAHSQPDHPFAVDTCEYLTDGAFALLRVSGTGTTAPVALVTQGDKPESFDPLPQPEAGPRDGSWQIAFALPAELAEPGTRLWLHDGGVYLADLRVPAPAGSGPKTPEPVADAPQTEERERVEAEVQADANDPRARKLVEAWSETAALREKLSEREEELAEALSELLTARKAGPVQSLRERAEQLTSELAEAQAELELVHKHGREARQRAKELTEQVDSLRAQLATVEPRIAAAELAQTEAEQEVAKLRARVEQLSDGREEVTQVESGGKSRRRGFGRRSDDRAVEKVRAELAAREERIAELEKEAESFAARRDEAVSESMTERIAELEEEVRQHATCTEDLRALLSSERELVASARREVHELKQQLATATANASRPTAPLELAVADSSDEPPVRRAPIEPPPWSALDDELLARIEKAKALTG